MKKNASKRILSAVLAFAMIFLMIPFSVLSVSVANDYSAPQDAHHLLSSYNALNTGLNNSGSDITAGDGIMSSQQIFNRNKLEELIKNYASYTNMYTQLSEVHEGKNITSFAASAGVSLSYSFGANIGIEKLFKNSLNRKFRFAADGKYEEAEQTYFYDYVVNVQKGYYFFDDAYLDIVRNSPEEYLSSAFLDSLINATPEEFFSKYGTHIITAYTAGGKAGVAISSVEKDNSLEVNLEAEYASGKTSSETNSNGIQLGFDNALELKGNISANIAEKNYTSTAYTYSYGGDESLKFSSEDASTFYYADWADSIDENNAAILVDERIKFVPVWNLLPVTGYEERILELTSYFLNESENQDSAFYNTYKIDEAMFDYSQDWLNFENCKIITNEEELNAIRDDLNGVYVLANNIVLSDYANWSPIGTKEEPFRGRLYGNYNTILGLDIDANVSNDTTVKTYVGLFGCNDGLITDLKISGDITMPPISVDNVYIGAISAYNKGIINNCYDGVQYNISYDDYSKLNLPVRNVDVSETTVIIGNEVGVCLSGEYTNITIQIADNSVESPAYIVLDGATVTGSINSDNDRPIYIISKGTANSITAPNDTIAVNALNTTVSIFGDVELTITGGNATSDNAPSAISVQSLAVNGSLTLNVVGGNGYIGYSSGKADWNTNGSSGGDGSNGGIAISAKQVIVHDATVNVTGGNGGNGGRGGDGNNGTSKRNGGKGGNGGHGAVALDIMTYRLDGATINVVSGKGGNGGNGGRAGGTTSATAGWGGDGGRGGNSGDIFYFKDNGTSIFTYEIGTAGSGGSGGYSDNSSKYGGSYGVGRNGMVINKFYSGHYYMLITTSASWKSAKVACENMGGYLVTITSEAENELMATLASGNAVWIGASDEETEGVWKWITGEAFSYTNWYSGEPNNSNGAEHYAHMRSDCDQWNDETSSITYYYICEWDSYEDYLLQFEDEPAMEEAPNALDGILCGANDNGTAETTDDGKLRTLNNKQWNDNILQITSVTKTEYFSGDTFDANTVKAQIYNSPIEYGKKFDSYCKETVLSRMGFVEITYDNHIRYIPVHVTKTIPSHIEIYNAGKTEFAVGEIFDISGLLVKVVYNNGDVKYISESDVTYTTPSTEDSGQIEEVVVTYDESGLFFSTSYEITVVTDVVESISIQNYPYKRTNYKQGDELSLDGLELYAYKKSGKKELIAIDNPGLDFVVSPSLCNVGTSTVTIKYNGQSATYTINVSENKDFDHPWDKGTVTLAPTHTATGIMTYRCTVDNCDAIKTETVPSLEGHVYGDWYKLNDTQHQRMCECGEAITMDHAWNVMVVTPATHTTAGEMLYTCTVCNATRIETIPPEVDTHTFGAWINHNNEQHTHACECGEVEYQNHNWNAGAVTVEPTYTTTGILTYTCMDCSATTTEVIPVIDIPDDAPYIVVDSKNAVVGSTVSVKISLQNNPGVTSMRINVAYDSTLLTLTDVAYNTAMGGQSVMPENVSTLNGNVILYWVDGFVNYEKDDVFATLTFKVSDSAVADATSTISVTYDTEDIYDADESNITYFCEDGVLTFINYIPGDINGDGVVNTKDTTRLMRYLANWDVEVNDAALDVNGDGVVNTKDTTRLMRYLAGWDVQIY